ncbi:MAG: GDSL-type esterase/lipase family protein [Flavihumibacter sp.]
MKKIVALLILAFTMTAMRSIPPKKKVVFFGDSITQAAVEKGGFITIIGEVLQKRGLAAGYELVGAGIGGDKVYDLYLRLENDVLSKKPDIVFIYVGVNDVWHKTLSHTGTDLVKFNRFYSALISKIQAAGAKVVLVTPAVIGEKKNGGNEQDKDLDIYSDAIRNWQPITACP